MRLKKKLTTDRIIRHNKNLNNVTFVVVKLNWQRERYSLTIDLPQACTNNLEPIKLLVLFPESPKKRVHVHMRQTTITYLLAHTCTHSHSDSLLTRLLIRRGPPLSAHDVSSGRKLPWPRGSVDNASKMSAQW